MSANKFILLPEDIYKGLTSTDTGNTNLDFTRRQLERVKTQRTDPTTKNARYNQELRRYLHLKKETEEKPVKVEMKGLEPVEAPSSPSPQSIAGTPLKTPKATREDELLNEMLMRISANPREYNVTDNNKIINDQGRIIEASNVKKSIEWIIQNQKGFPVKNRPNGTQYIERIINNDNVLLRMLEALYSTPPSEKISSSETPKRSFKPLLWSRR